MIDAGESYENKELESPSSLRLVAFVFAGSGVER